MAVAIVGQEHYDVANAVKQQLNRYKELKSSKNIIACLIGGDGKSSKIDKDRKKKYEHQLKKNLR